MIGKFDKSYYDLVLKRTVQGRYDSIRDVRKIITDEIDRSIAKGHYMALISYNANSIVNDYKEIVITELQAAGFGVTLDILGKWIRVTWGENNV